MKKSSPPPLTGRQLGVMFVLFFLANCVVVYLAHRLYPHHVVLETYFHTELMALAYSMAVLTIGVIGAVVLVEHFLQTTKADLIEIHWLFLFLLLNSGGIWGVARLAAFLGLGITSWRVAVILGVILALFQRALVKAVVEKVYRYPNA